MRDWTSAAIIALSLSATYPAFAETARHDEIVAKYPACTLSQRGNMLGEFSAQKRIEVCTAAIDSKAYDGEDLAVFYFNRSTLRNQLKQYAAAQADIDAALKAWPDIARSLIARAGTYNDIHQFDLALTDLTKAQPSAADVPQLYYNFAATYLHRREFALARANIQKAIELQPEDADTRMFLAEIESVAGDNDAAIAAADASVALGDMARSYAWRCLIRLVANRDLAEMALPDCNMAVQIEPTYFVGLNARGMLYERLGRYKDAITDFDAAMMLTGRAVIPIYGRALAEKKLGLKDRAATDLAFAKYLSPDVAKWYGKPEMLMK